MNETTPALKVGCLTNAGKGLFLITIQDQKLGEKKGK